MAIMHPISDSLLIATLDQDREEGLSQFLAKSTCPKSAEAAVYNLLCHAIFNDKKRLTRHIVQNTLLGSNHINSALQFSADERQDWACDILVKAPNLIRMDGNEETISKLIDEGYFAHAQKVYASDLKSQTHSTNRFLTLLSVDLLLTNQSLTGAPLSDEQMDALFAMTNRILQDCQSKHDLRGLVEGERRSFNQRSSKKKTAHRQYEDWLITIRQRYIELPEPQDMVERQHVNKLIKRMRPKIKSPKLS